MGAKVSEVGWGDYLSYSGPLFWGKQKVKKIEDLTMGRAPDNLDKYVYVVCQTEGAAYDAVNFYDRCICTVGLIQFCDVHPNYFVANMLGDVADECGLDYVLNCLQPALDMVKGSFKKNAIGKYRFTLNGVEVNNAFMQKQLYFGGSSGLKGQWTPNQKIVAKTWVACLTSIWDDPKARAVQVKYTKDKVMSFAFGDGKKVLWDDEPTSDTGLALRAVYLSYAANLPALASKITAATAAKSTNTKWSDDWCKEIAHALVFSSGIAIWPERYNKIMPAVKQHFGGNLPINKEKLAAWKSGKTVEETKPEPKQEPTQEPKLEAKPESNTEPVVTTPAPEKEEPKQEAGLTTTSTSNFFTEFFKAFISFFIEIMAKFKK